jgi:hypothetical protein
MTLLLFSLHYVKGVLAMSTSHSTSSRFSSSGLPSLVADEGRRLQPAVVPHPPFL